MVTSGGMPLTAGITLPVETESITVSSDGIVSAKLPGQATPQQVGVIELANFINPAAWSRWARTFTAKAWPRATR